MGRNKEDDEVIEKWYSYIETVTYSILDSKEKIFKDHGAYPQMFFEIFVRS